VEKTEKDSTRHTDPSDFREVRVNVSGEIREDCVFIGAWVPSTVITAIDQAVKRLDSDRSKFLRKALEEKIRKPATVAN